MKLHPYFTAVPVAGAIGTTAMMYNASVNIAKQAGALHNKSDGFGTSALNFMGAQDAFIAGALFIGFATLARGTYFAAQAKNHRGSKWFEIAGAMIFAAGLYALSAGFSHNGIANSKLGEFSNKGEAIGFGLVYSVLTLIGAALAATGYQMSTKKVFRNSTQPEAYDRPDNSSDDKKVSVDL
jgi:hypothetical protein